MEEERKTQLHAVFSFVIALAVLGTSVVLAVVLILNRRVADQQPLEKSIPTVEAQTVSLGNHPVKISTQGQVTSRRETMLAAELSGRVVEISPNLKRGGVVSEGERLVQIDPSDYRAALARAESGLADAELALAQEESRAEQARLDWQRLGRGTGIPLVLREPQLAAAKAKAASARAEVERATRDLERTEIRAPFDAGVREAVVEVGAVTAPGQRVAELFSSSDLEVRLPVSLEDFGFLRRDAAGLPQGVVTLSGKIGAVSHEWKAEPVRLDPEIDNTTLSGHLVVRVVPEPGAGFPLPPVGLFVQAVVPGITLEKVLEIPRRAIREGGEALVITPENKLEFRPLEIIRTTRDTAIVRSGLADGERLCLTRLSAPVTGMEVRVEAPVEQPR